MKFGYTRVSTDEQNSDLQIDQLLADGCDAVASGIKTNRPILEGLLNKDHRFIKKITKPMMNFKAFHSASSTLSGIELAHMIRKKHFKNKDLSDYHQFLELVA
jgi:transposase-like protein